MSYSARILSIVALVCTCGLQVSAQVTVLYDNLAPPDWGLFFPSSVEIGSEEVGDEIILASGTPRTLNTFSLQYFTEGFSGSEQVRIRFYENTGPAVSGAPSPNAQSFFDSGSQPVPVGTGTALLTLNNLNVQLPESFTWSVQFSGVSGVKRSGIAIHGPATVGSSQVASQDDFWEKVNGEWSLFQFTQGNPVPASSFGAQMTYGTAVPEPAAWAALSGIGLLLFAVSRRFLLRASAAA